MPLDRYNFGAMTDAQKVIGKAFMKSPTFAVVGASKDQSKVGNEILRWYQARDTHVIPVHPKERELEGLKTITDISQLSSPSTTALSIITPPQITLSVLKKAKELNVPFYWIQPGAEDEVVLEYIKENGLIDRAIYGGPCILVLGDGIRSHLPRACSHRIYATFMQCDTLFDINLRDNRSSLPYLTPESSVPPNYAMLSSTLPICEKQERFFASSQFAVIGASSDPSKLVSKVLDWYQNKHMDVIPVHPKEKRLDGLSAIPSISKLPSPSTTALTISATPQVGRL
ncbi:hypothetical protein C0993_003739 [Termitomyces sp. T159_Od127]|nr:hypothetical protein C0993_003739 [Termitomyces sp. T159_Od127]